MGEILGLTISDFPFHRFKPQYEVGVIQGGEACSRYRHNSSWRSAWALLGFPNPLLPTLIVIA